jgi:hypothetical protein
MKSNEPEWESPRQSAEALGVCRATVYGLIGEGKLDARKLGDRTIISIKSRREFAENLPKAEIAPRKTQVRGAMRGEDKLFRVSGRWALASDELQWILLRQKGPERWQGVSFVRSTRDVLARCMREKGTPTDDARRLLDGLPATFDEWRASRSEAGSSASALGDGPSPPPEAFDEPCTGLPTATDPLGEEAHSAPSGAPETVQ